MTSIDRPSSIRFFPTLPRISSLNLFGDDRGRELFVGIGWIPIFLDFFTHLVMVPGDTPYRRATVLTPIPFCSTSCAASLLTLGARGFVVYAIA
jgi:hypothetical protein